MTPPKRANASNGDIVDLLKKLLILQLFAMNIPQADIAKKVRMNIVAVNAFLKGIKKNK